MSPQHIRIATKTGYAWFGLNDGKLLVLFRVDENSPALRTIQIDIQNAKAVYDMGWRLDVLLWVIDNYQPLPRLIYTLSDNVHDVR